MSALETNRRSRIPPWLAALILLGAALAWGGVTLWQIRRSPARAHIEAGNAFAQQGDALRAVAEWQAATKIDPNHAYAWQALGQTFYDAQDWTRADEALREAVRLAPQTPRLRGLLAACQWQRGETEAARESAQAALKRSPHDIPALETLAAYYDRRGDSDGWIDALRRLSEAEPKNAERLVALAKALVRENALPELLPVADRILEIAPDRIEVYALRGVARFYADTSPDALARAEADLRKTLERYPALYEPHLYLGRIHRRRGEWAPAIAQLTEAARLRPDLPDAYFDLGLCYQRTGQRDRAAAARRRFLPLARANEAFVHIKRQADLAPQDAAANLRAGRMALARKDHAAAARYLELARRAKPDDPAVDAARAALAAATAAGDPGALLADLTARQSPPPE